MLFAHHVAVEIFGREFSPQTPLQHVCAFTAVGLVLALAVYGGCTLAARIWNYTKSHTRAQSA